MQARNMSIYIVCISVLDIRTDWDTLFRVVLPLMDTSAGLCMEVARRTCSAVAVVFLIVPSFRARIILVSGGDAKSLAVLASLISLLVYCYSISETLLTKSCG